MMMAHQENQLCRLLIISTLLLFTTAFIPPLRAPSSAPVTAPALVHGRIAAALPRSRSTTSGSPTTTSTLISHSHGGAVAPSPVLIKAPHDMYHSAVESGTHKAEEPAPSIFISAIQAGFQVGIGGAMAAATMAGLPGLQASDPSLAKLIYGVCGLPCGLLMTQATGNMLFTGNTALVGMAWMEKKIKLRQLVKSWFFSYMGNFLGATLLAALCTYAGVFSSATAGMVSLAAYKASLPFGVAFARGILCNWLVTTAVFIAQACSDLVSKATIVVMIITIFASLGFEHSVANMFVGPFGAFNGGPTFMTFFLKNLIPASLGNIVGGFGVVGFWYYITLGSGGKIWRKK